MYSWNYQYPSNRSLACYSLCYGPRVNLFESEYNFSTNRNLRGIIIKIIKHKKGADPAAVAFDAVEHARAKGKELVLVDTAGRMQTNVNLMDEMKKIKRVIKPDLYHICW